MSENLPVLSIHDGQPMADSREVAGTFGKRHTEVLRSYRDLHCSAEFRRRNFASFKTKDLTGESLSHVLMTKDGFAFLVLGFTGSAAGVFKEAYVERFNAMEAELRRQASPAIPQSLPEALRLAADLAEQVGRQSAQIAVLEPRSAALATIADTGGSWCVRDAAGLLGLREKDLRAYLRQEGWLYRRNMLDPWKASAKAKNAGWLTTKIVPVDTGGARPWNRDQARITAAGLTLLAVRLSRPVPAEASADFALAPARA